MRNYTPFYWLLTAGLLYGILRPLARVPVSCWIALGTGAGVLALVVLAVLAANRVAIGTCFFCGDSCAFCPCPDGFHLCGTHLNGPQDLRLTDEFAGHW